MSCPNCGYAFCRCGMPVADTRDAELATLKVDLHTALVALAACREQLAAESKRVEQLQRSERVGGGDASMAALVWLATNQTRLGDEAGRGLHRSHIEKLVLSRAALLRDYTALHSAASAVSEAHQLIENEGEEGNLVQLVRALATLSALLTEPAGGSEEKPT